MSAKSTRAKPPARRKASTASNETDEQFAPILEAFRNNARVSLARMFGSVGLKVNGKVFVMLVKGDLVVKLPKERVEALVGARLGKHFDPGHGKVMKEWVAMTPRKCAEWVDLAKEAQRFVASVQ